jgi:hypothetical protein
VLAYKCNSTIASFLQLAYGQVRTTTVSSAKGTRTFGQRLFLRGIDYVFSSLAANLEKWEASGTISDVPWLFLVDGTDSSRARKHVDLRGRKR